MKSCSQRVYCKSRRALQNCIKIFFGSPGPKVLKVTSTSVFIVNGIEEYFLKIFHHEAYKLEICYYNQQDRAPRAMQNDIKIF